MKRRQTPLQKLRGELDKIDARLIRLLGQRFAVIRKVAKVKRKDRIPVRQKAEISRRLALAARAAGRGGVSESFARKLMRLVIEESMRLQGR